MKDKEKIYTPEVLRTLLDYDETTGCFHWKIRGPEWFKTPEEAERWNKKWAGRPTFTSILTDGYYVGNINKTCFRAHRVAWAWVYGEWSPEDIDHINGIRTDNRIENLRSVTRSENLKNMVRLHGKNEHGNIATTAYGTFLVQVWSNGRYITQKTFKTLPEAIYHRDQTLAANGFTKRHGKAA